MSKIIDGRETAFHLLQNVKMYVEHLCHQHDIVPGLAVIIIGDHLPSKIYVKIKTQKASEIGISSYVHSFQNDVEEEEILKLIMKLNDDIKIHGILIQMPLPRHINLNKVLDAIDPQKDVDGFTSHNVGLLNLWRRCLEPCTPHGIIYLLKKHLKRIEGKNAVVIGRSFIVGRPLATMLLRENCTTTILHSLSSEKKIISSCHEADILIAAVGQAKMIKKSWVKDGACVIDVGINALENNKICGDVDFDGVYEKASLITPVPGGVGPMTVASLLANTVRATFWQRGIVEDPEDQKLKEFLNNNHV